MKSGGKKALRLLDNPKEADLLVEAKGAGHYVEFRKGESIRCQSFCLCRRFCNFYHENVKSPTVNLMPEKMAA